MINIPTELLRTLVAVVDLRSFTRAAQTLGVTQPAVSAQIKRLQTMLGGELLDKSAPGVTLTTKGAVVVNHARRLLAINDQILDATAGGAADRIRIGLTADYVDGPALKALAQFRARHPQLRFQVNVAFSDTLLRDLERGDCDLVVAVSDTAEMASAKHIWRETAVWAAAKPGGFGAQVPLVTLGESSLTGRIAVAALQQAGYAYDVVYVGRSLPGVVGAVASGLGIACLARRHVQASGLVLLNGDAPKLRDYSGAVLVREGLQRSDIDELAGLLAQAIEAGEA